MLGGALVATSLYKQYKCKMKSSLIIKIFLLIILSIILPKILYAQSIALDTVYVTSEKYSIENEMRKRAQTDITNGDVHLEIYGYVILSVNKNQLDSLTTKYGFKYNLGGCVIPKGAEAYNTEVMLYLNKRNGEGWWEKFNEEYKKLEQVIKPLPKKPD